MNVITIRCAGWTIIVSLTLLLSCKQANDANLTPTASQECQLQSELTVSNGSQQATTYTYNDKGQLIKTVAASSSGTPTTYTFSYDATGNVSSAFTQGATTSNTSFSITNAYQYTSGRLVKLTAQSSSSLFASTTDSYSYDGAGQLATYSNSSSDPNHGIESYTFTNGLLT